jgi:hypothetical protein
MSFDAVVCCHSKDFMTLPLCVAKLRKNVQGVDTIYIISNTNPNVTGTQWLPETDFPFTLKEVMQYVPAERAGWYLQQLLKFYSVFKTHHPTVLIVDADTLFLNPITMVENGVCLYAYGKEYHLPYFEQMKRLHPSLYKVKPMSGICHHMMIERLKVNSLFLLVELYHGMPFWKAFLVSAKGINKTAPSSGASEYEIYFNYILANFPNDIAIRPLKWKNSAFLKDIEQDEKKGYTYVSYHSYLR